MQSQLSTVETVFRFSDEQRASVHKQSRRQYASWPIWGHGQRQTVFESLQKLDCAHELTRWVRNLLAASSIFIAFLVSSNTMKLYSFRNATSSCAWFSSNCIFCLISSISCHRPSFSSSRTPMILDAVEASSSLTLLVSCCGLNAFWGCFSEKSSRRLFLFDLTTRKGRQNPWEPRKQSRRTLVRRR